MWTKKAPKRSIGNKKGSDYTDVNDAEQQSCGLSVKGKFNKWNLDLAPKGGSVIGRCLEMYWMDVKSFSWLLRTY
jgi:hypothetical protein